MKIKILLAVLLCFVTGRVHAQKLSALTTTNAVVSTNTIPIVANGGTYKVTVATLAAAMSTGSATNLTPWASDINGATFNLTNAGAIFNQGFDSQGMSIHSFRAGESAGLGMGNAINHVVIGYQAGLAATNADSSTFVGYIAGQHAYNANSSAFYGYAAGADATNASTATFIGSRAGQNATNSYQSVFVGYRSGMDASAANSSVYSGYFSGYHSTNADSSVFEGFSAGTSATNASKSVFIGRESGANTGSADHSIFIGPWSGINRARTLWIDTSATTQNGSYTPLIYGEFDNRLFKINGHIVATNLVASKILVSDALSGITNSPLGISDLVATTRAINTSGPLAGGGALSSDLTLTVSNATSTAFGVVKPDGSSITVSGGVLSATAGGTVITNSFGITIDGGGSVITAGSKGYITVPNGGQIYKVTMLADQSGSLIVDIYKCTYANFDAGATHPVSGDKITASAPPTITTSTKSTDSTLTGWTKGVLAGDVFGFTVTGSPSAITRCNIVVEYTH